jgi:tetratricopeptide (TPR) repeat protein
MLPGSSEVAKALGLIARREGHWGQSIAYLEQALALDPRNVEVLIDTAGTYIALRQFPAALKLYDRALDIVPNNPDWMADKANIYQAEGNLQEAAKFLSEINEQTPSEITFSIKIIQLRLERNYAEAVRLLQARQAQFHYGSEPEKDYEKVELAFMQRLAGMPLAQMLPLDRCATASSSSTEINRITTSLWPGWLWQMPRLGRRTRP